ncbi:hypothetical protein GWI33_002782 [Rhynchophorus ferrugineus]|uniref:Uncharacterized protein n=1 Tax=Rhynchophorus ferrugineus TaxID=354439 RepID=A0A834MFD9_RHYFE|nr:hypothetical protein GWI33_002782 [Rhynchophorus ferrugineus]
METAFHSYITMLLLLSVLVDKMVAISQLSDLNNKCSYTMNKVILTCADLEEVNQNLEPLLTDDTRVLILKKCKDVNLIQGKRFERDHPNLNNYQIIASERFYVDQHSFYGLTNLKYLYIQKTPWKEILENSFKGLKNLQVLNLVNNRIKILNKKSFAQLTNLESLDLSQNSLETLGSHIFKSLENLETLYLLKNNIATISHNSFEGLQHLINLMLAHNNLEQIEVSTFNGLKSLKHLNLEFNSIEKIVGDFDLPKLQFLNLGHNKLIHIHNSVFKNCKDLESVDLSYNNIQQLNHDPFLGLKILRHLNLMQNNISRERERQK